MNMSDFEPGLFESLFRILRRNNNVNTVFRTRAEHEEFSRVGPTGGGSSKIFEIYTTLLFY